MTDTLIVMCARPPPLPPNVVARTGKARVCGGLECRTKLELRRSVSLRAVSGEALQGKAEPVREQVWAARKPSRGRGARHSCHIPRNAQVREAGAGTAIANCVDLHSGITDMHLTESRHPSSRPDRAGPDRDRAHRPHRAAPTAGRAAASVLRAPSHRHGSIAASSVPRRRYVVVRVFPRLHSDACAAVRWFAVAGRVAPGCFGGLGMGFGLGRSHVPASRPFVRGRSDTGGSPKPAVGGRARA